MNAIVAKSARHPQAAIAWATVDAIFVEFPTTTGVPYIVRYHKTVEGLQSALNILLERPAPTMTIQRDHPMLKKVASTPDSVRAQASAIVSAMLLKGKAQ